MSSIFVIVFPNQRYGVNAPGVFYYRHRDTTVPASGGTGAPTRNDMTILGANSLFANRVRASLIVYCNGTVIPESMTASFHKNRYGLALSVLNSPDGFKSRFAQEAATDTNVINDATGSGFVVLTTGNVASQQANVTDAHMDTAVAAAFNSFINVVN